jgi:hypothetical protein
VDRGGAGGVDGDRVLNRQALATSSVASTKPARSSQCRSRAVDVEHAVGVGD